MTFENKFIKSSEIGKRSMVAYRAKKLGIEPQSYSKRFRQWLYSVEDADRILAYRQNQVREHHIRYYDVLEAILKTENLRNNVEFSAKMFKIRVTKIKSIMDEYYSSQCFVTPSKMNIEKKESQDY